MSRIPEAVSSVFLNYSPALLPTYLIFGILAIVVIAGVVFVNEGERKVPVSYAKQVRGNRMFGGVSTYLPLKVNQAGVIPIIFAISLLLFPQFFAQMVAVISLHLSLKLNAIVSKFFNNLMIYSALYFALVVVFTYFYTAITFDPDEIAKNLQRSGGFIPGIRPGNPTAEHIAKILNRITLFGALFLGFIAILPLILKGVTGIAGLALGGTALLIVISVVLDLIKKIDSQISMQEY